MRLNIRIEAFFFLCNTCAQPKTITSQNTLSAEVAVPRILAPPDLVLETALSASGDEKREEIRRLLGARREAVRRTRAFPV